VRPTLKKKVPGRAFFGVGAALELVGCRGQGGRGTSRGKKVPIAQAIAAFKRDRRAPAPSAIYVQMAFRYNLGSPGLLIGRNPTNRPPERRALAPPSSDLAEVT
jgi:hypothetical protein